MRSFVRCVLPGTRKILSAYCDSPVHSVDTNQTFFLATMTDVSGATRLWVGCALRLGFSNDADCELLRIDHFSAPGCWLSGCSSFTALHCTGLAHVRVGRLLVVRLHQSKSPGLQGTRTAWERRLLAVRLQQFDVLDCAGLAHLRTVGDDWLASCTSLTAWIARHWHGWP